MKIKRSDLKRIIESFLKEEDEKKQVSDEEIEQSIRDAEDDIVANQTADKRKEFLKKHGKKIPENVIQSLGAMARPLILKLNKSDLKKDSVLLSRVFSFLRKGENQTAIDILKSVKEVPVTADRKTKKIIKRKLSDEGLKTLKASADYSQIIEVIEKYIDAGKKEVEDDYDFLSGGNEEESESTPSEPIARKKTDTKTKIKEIQQLIQAPSSEGGSKLGDGSWGPASFKAWQSFIEVNKMSILNANLLSQTYDDPESNPLMSAFDIISAYTYADAKKDHNAEQKHWGWTDIYDELSQENKEKFSNNYDGMLKFIKFIKAQKTNKENPEKDYFGDSEDYGQSEQEETPKEKSKEESSKGGRTKESKNKWIKGAKTNMAPASYVDYQENTAVPLNNISLEHNDWTTGKMALLWTSKSSDYSSYNNRKRTDTFSNLKDFMGHCQQSNIPKNLSDVGGAQILYKELPKSKFIDRYKANTYKFASDVHLEWHCNPDKVKLVQKSGINLSDGCELVLFINGPMGFNYYIKGYKYDAIKNMIVNS